MTEQIMRGLKGVFFDTTEASFIDGERGKLLYRGYNIHDLAEQSTFEEVIYLLLYGALPNRQQLQDFDATLRANRIIPEEVIRVLDLVKESHPMDALRTGVSALAAFDPEVADNSAEANIHKGIRLTAMAPTIVAAHHRLRQGLEPVTPDPDLGHAGNFLYMLFNDHPDDETTRLLDVDFILHAEHGANASAFGARITASTLSDLHSAVVSGIAVLKGPWHGGAAEEVMKMAMEIGQPKNAEDWARKVLESKGRIRGFGHRVYKVEDARAFQGAGRKNGPASLVPDFELPRREGHGPLPLQRYLRQCRLLCGFHLLSVGNPRGPVHIHLRPGAYSWLDPPVSGAI